MQARFEVGALLGELLARGHVGGDADGAAAALGRDVPAHQDPARRLAARAARAGTRARRSRRARPAGRRSSRATERSSGWTSAAASRVVVGSSWPGGSPYTRAAFGGPLHRSRARVPLPGAHVRALEREAKPLLAVRQRLLGGALLRQVGERADPALEPAARVRLGDGLHQHPADLAVGPDDPLLELQRAPFGERAPRDLEDPAVVLRVERANAGVRQRFRDRHPGELRPALVQVHVAPAVVDPEDPDRHGRASVWKRRSLSRSASSTRCSSVTSRETTTMRFSPSAR